MVIWVLYKRFLKNGPEQNDNTITQKYDKNRNVRTGKVICSSSSLSLSFRFVVASASPLF